MVNRRKRKRGGSWLFHGKKQKDGLEIGPWYNPYVKVLNTKKILKNAGKRAAKSAIHPTVNETKKILWNKQTKERGKKIALDTLGILRKKIVTKENKSLLEKAGKRATKSFLKKTTKSFFTDPKTKKLVSDHVNAFVVNKIIGAIMP